MDERVYWLSFSIFPGVGPLLFQALLGKFGSAKDAWNASDKDLRIVLKNKLTEKFVSFRKTFSLEEYEKELVAKKVWFVTLGEDGYPELLKKIKNPPFVLYVKGYAKILHSVQNDKREFVSRSAAKDPVRFQPSRVGLHPRHASLH